MGRLDHLVEAVYDRFKDRYYPDESTSLRCPYFQTYIVQESNLCPLSQRFV